MPGGTGGGGTRFGGTRFGSTRIMLHSGNDKRRKDTIAMDVKKVLERVSSGVMDVAEAEALLKDLPYEDLGYAKLDHHRKLRSGFGETVFCQGKPDPYLVEIMKRFYERDGEVLGTRIFQWRRKQPRRRNILAARWTGSMMWAWRESTACCHRGIDS